MSIADSEGETESEPGKLWDEYSESLKRAGDVLRRP